MVSFQDSERVVGANCVVGADCVGDWLRSMRSMRKFGGWGAFVVVAFQEGERSGFVVFPGVNEGRIG